jgi:cytochrome P450
MSSIPDLIAEKPDHVPAELVRDFDMYNDAGLREKAQAHYREMLGHYPDVFWSPYNGGHWVVMGSEAVHDAFRDWESFRNSGQNGIGGQPGPVEELFIPIQLDPPRHERYRALINPLLGPRAVMAMEGQIRTLANELIDAVEANGECDFVDSISLPLPVKIFMMQMGLPLDRYREFAGWVQTFLNGDTVEQRNDALMRFQDLLTGLLQDRKASPTDDWMSQLLAMELDGRQLDVQTEALPIAMLLFVGGLDTVKNTLGQMFRVLAGRPDLQAWIRKNPADIPEALEELFRYLGGTTPPRRVGVDVEFHGAPMRKDDMLAIVTGTVGIDARAVDRPFEIDFEREQKPHAAFGTGPHRCAGSNLARLEMRVLIEEWFSRIPEFRIKPGTSPVFNPGTVNAIDGLIIEW